MNACQPLPCGYCDWTFDIPDDMIITQALLAVRDHQATEHPDRRPQVIILGGHSALE